MLMAVSNKQHVLLIFSSYSPRSTLPLSRLYSTLCQLWIPTFVKCTVKHYSFPPLVHKTFCKDLFGEYIRTALTNRFGNDNHVFHFAF